MKDVTLGGKGSVKVSAVCPVFQLMASHRAVKNLAEK